jgi:hypothetical protein
MGKDAIEVIRLDNWLYVNEIDNSSRFVLGQNGVKPLIVFGINPSIAEPANIGSSDPTIEKIKRIAKKMNCDGWIMLNIYPQRSTNPNDLHLEIDNELHKKNVNEIEKVLNKHPDAILIGAWGNLISKRKYLPKCLVDIFHMTNKFNKQWHCFETNITGHPRHPLYLKEKNLTLINFDIENYIRKY